ncbi:hypothetical protein GCM10009610_47250 [Pseudonocardia xinjiangensis]
MPQPAAGSTRAQQGSVRRPELQGLRALAIILVVVYHVWIDRVPGGVDVFFLLTGFLLTGGLVRAAEARTLDVRRQWSRTLRRLEPAAAVVRDATHPSAMALRTGAVDPAPCSRHLCRSTTTGCVSRTGTARPCAGHAPVRPLRPRLRAEPAGRPRLLCGTARADVYPRAPPWTRLPDIPSNLTFLDIADTVCDTARCPAVIGNIVVYLDDNHLSATYSTTMADLLAEPLRTTQ